jgi:hypothetical protein
MVVEQKRVRAQPLLLAVHNRRGTINLELLCGEAAVTKHFLDEVGGL